MADWLVAFPSLPRETLLGMRRGIDEAYREFSRTYGVAIEDFFDPLLQFMIWFEQLLLNSPWWLVIAVVAATDIGAFFAGRSVGGPRLAPRLSPAKT